MHDGVQRRLSGLLVGTSFTSVSYADQWTLRTDAEVFLIAQEIGGSTADEIETALATASDRWLASVDPRVVPVAASVFLALRKPIVGVQLRDDASLILSIGDGLTLQARVDADVVDWQWSVSRTRNDPYVDFEVACFWRGEVQERATVSP